MSQKDRAYQKTQAARDAREMLKDYTTDQLLELQRACATLEGKARIQGEITRRRQAADRAERNRRQGER